MIPIRSGVRVFLSGLQLVGLMSSNVELALALPQFRGGRNAQIQGLSTGANQEIRVVGPRALVEWESFSIDQGEQFFIRGNESQSILNLVSGPDASRIAGSVLSEVRFILANPNGISVLGSGSVVAPAVLFSTAKINPDDWLQATGLLNDWNDSWLSIPPSPGAAINLSGQIIAKPTDGRGGRIQLHADQIQLQGAFLSAQGSLSGGVIEIGAPLQRSASDGVVAKTVLIDEASIVDVSSTTIGDGGSIAVGSQISGGLTSISGQLLSDGAGADGRGGVIQVTGEAVRILGDSMLQASGQAAGGSIHVGGSWQNSDPSVPQSSTTLVESGASLRADATRSGSGGEVVVWSDVNNPDGWTIAQGLFSAQAGSEGGDGGRIETSGYWLDVTGASGSAGATFGKSGMWLFDPYNIRIVAGAGTTNNDGPPGFEPNGNSSEIGVDLINLQLDGNTSVTISTTGDGVGLQTGNIVLDAAILKDDGNSDVTLSLFAANDIEINSSIDSSGASIGALSVVLEADNDNGISDGFLIIVGHIDALRGGAGVTH